MMVTICAIHMLTLDWASSIDDSENTFIPSRPRPQPLSSIEHLAEPVKPARTNITYPVIQPTPSPNGIKPHVANIAKGKIC